MDPRPVCRLWLPKEARRAWCAPLTGKLAQALTSPVKAHRTSSFWAVTMQICWKVEVPEIGSAADLGQTSSEGDVEMTCSPPGLRAIDSTTWTGTSLSSRVVTDVISLTGI